MKAEPFLICATPRSGSAWLANFLTYDGCLCLHEPLAGGLWPEGEYRLKGAVDTGAAHFLPAILEGYPRLRVYRLTRDAEAASASLARLGLPDIPSPLVDAPAFAYERLFEVNYLQDLWAEIVGTPFDRLRAAMLIEMNVQRSITALQQRATQWLG